MFRIRLLSSSQALLRSPTVLPYRVSLRELSGGRSAKVSAAKPTSELPSKNEHSSNKSDNGTKKKVKPRKGIQPDGQLLGPVKKPRATPRETTVKPNGATTNRAGVKKGNSKTKDEEKKLDKPRNIDVDTKSKKKTLSRSRKINKEEGDVSADWEDKSGSLYKPRHTGFPEADRIAEQILVGYGGVSKRGSKGDTKRLHIVRKELCDDILERLKPSLQKHVGCDIIELNPGPGVWSSAVHKALNPRTHILMEPDAELYKPLLQPLLDAEGSTYKLIPRSGTVWSHLEGVLTSELLPNQEKLTIDDPRIEEPNNTLLFMANLGYYPRKIYRGFPSVSNLVMHQLISAVRAHSLFHKYGLVRMLIWLPDDDKHIIFPKNITYRRKSAIEAELSCSEIYEVASSTHNPPVGLREHRIDLESSISTLRRMEAAKIHTPPGREKPLQLEALEASRTGLVKDEMSVERPYLLELAALEAKYAAGEFEMYQDDPDAVQSMQKSSIKDFWTPEYERYTVLKNHEQSAKNFGRSFGAGMAEELNRLRSAFGRGEISKYIVSDAELPIRGRKFGGVEFYTPEFKRIHYLRHRRTKAEKNISHSQLLLQEYEQILETQKRLTTMERTADTSVTDTLRDEIAQRTKSLRDQVSLLGEENAEQLYLQLANRRTFYQDPPILLWDRRQVEPLQVEAAEFFPRHEMSLLDFQPKSIWPILRENFPANYDVFEYIVSYLLLHTQQSVREGFLGLYPGAFEWLVAECPSLTDPNKGGDIDLEMLTVRELTLEMYKEIIEAWMKWPFRPSRYELIRRMGSSTHEHDSEEYYHEEE